MASAGEAELSSAGEGPAKPDPRRQIFVAGVDGIAGWRLVDRMSRGAGAIRLPILLAVIPIPSIDFPVPLRTHAGRATTASQVVLSERNRLLELLL
jgi:hypothetical protein